MKTGGWYQKIGETEIFYGTRKASHIKGLRVVVPFFI